MLNKDKPFTGFSDPTAQGVRYVQDGIGYDSNGDVLGKVDESYKLVDVKKAKADDLSPTV